MENLIKIKSEIGVQLTDRELSVRWWERLQRAQKQTLLNQYTPNMKIEHMFINDIYWVWLKQQDK
jgi:hypothetical protein